MIPSGGMVKVDYASCQPQQFPLDRDPQNREQFNRAIDSVQESFSYTIFLGDNHSQQFKVDAEIRPAVTGLDCTQIYPSYTRLSPEHRPPGDLSLLAGSRLAINVTANKAVKPTPDAAGNHIHFHGSEVDYPLAANVNDLTKLIAKEGIEPSVPVPPGTTGFTIELVDQYGLRSKDPAFYRIDLLPDHPPTVRINAPEQKDSTVTTVAQPNIGVEAADDFALGKLAIRYRITHAGQDLTGAG